MGQDLREWRRLRAWELHEAEWGGKAIAEALKASQAAVSTWLKRARIGGVETLRRYPPPGRTPKLSAEQRAQLPALLVAGAAQRLHLEQLPAYAPELNPAEGVWILLKRRELKNRCCRDLDDLRRELGPAIRRLRRRAHLLAACFRHGGSVQEPMLR
jgi:transposase